MTNKEKCWTLTNILQNFTQLFVHILFNNTPYKWHYSLSDLCNQRIIYVPNCTSSSQYTQLNGKFGHVCACMLEKFDTFVWALSVKLLFLALVGFTFTIHSSWSVIDNCVYAHKGQNNRTRLFSRNRILSSHPVLLSLSLQSPGFLIRN